MELTYKDGVAYVNANLKITADKIPDEYLDLWIPCKISRPFEGIEIDELYSAFRAAYSQFELYHNFTIEYKYYDLFKYNLYKEKWMRAKGIKAKRGEKKKIFDFSTYDLLYEIDPMLMEIINEPQYI